MGAGIILLLQDLVPIRKYLPEVEFRSDKWDNNKFPKTRREWLFSLETSFFLLQIPVPGKNDLCLFNVYIRCLMKRHFSPPSAQIRPLFLCLLMSLSNSWPMRNCCWEKLRLYIRDKLLISQWEPKQQSHLLNFISRILWIRHRIIYPFFCQRFGARPSLTYFFYLLMFLPAL